MSTDPLQLFDEVRLLESWRSLIIKTREAAEWRQYDVWDAYREVQRDKSKPHHEQSIVLRILRGQQLPDLIDYEILRYVLDRRLIELGKDTMMPPFLSAIAPGDGGGEVVPLRIDRRRSDDKPTCLDLVALAS